jgi:hypothetical protein
MTLLTSKEEFLLFLDQENNDTSDLDFCEQKLISEDKENLTLSLITLPLILLIQ